MSTNLNKSEQIMCELQPKKYMGAAGEFAPESPKRKKEKEKS